MARKRSRKNKGTKAGTAPDTNLINANLWQQELNKKLPSAKQQALERIVLAGMKVMFSPQTHKMMLQELEGPGDIVHKLAQAATRLMIMLYKESNGTMPGDLLIPAAGVLIAKACEFLNQSGDTVTEQQFRAALVETSRLIMKVAGAPDSHTNQMAGPPSHQTALPPSSTPPAPVPPPAAPVPPAGGNPLNMAQGATP